MTSPKHVAIGFNAFKRGEPRDPVYGAGVALYSQIYTAAVQAAYDAGWTAAQNGQPLPLPPALVTISAKQQEDLFA